MNLPVILSNVGKAIRQTGGMTWLFAKKHAPEIMIGGGLVGFAVTIGETVVATNKTNDILEEREEREALIKREVSDNPAYTPEMAENDRKQLRKATRRKLCKTWFPVVSTATASGAAILGGYRIINGRYVATAAAYKTLEDGFDRYRSNVVKEFGKDVDWRMANGYSAEEMKAIQKERDEQKKSEGSKERRKGKPSRYHSEYRYRFDPYSSRHWQRYWIPQQMLDFVQYKTRQLNDKFQSDGYLFVNDVLEAFGMEKTSEGQVVGWIKRKGHTNIVSVGYDEAPEEEIRRVLGTKRNDDLYWYLNMNPDGLIYTMIDGVDLQDRYYIE